MDRPRAMLVCAAHLNPRRVAQHHRRSKALMSDFAGALTPKSGITESRTGHARRGRGAAGAAGQRGYCVLRVLAQSLSVQLAPCPGAGVRAFGCYKATDGTKSHKVVVVSNQKITESQFSI